MPTRRTLANAIRALSMDAVQKANSGHPGAPMGMADIAEVLWNQYLKHNPRNPNWWNRDRFVLSNGHGSMLIYSLLHLTGYALSIDDLKNFRQLHAKTAGHPEYREAPGIETTTGPLGQGLSNAVGMALAEKMLAAQFNRDEFEIIDHYTYTFLGDGCLMEGISHEACALAGTWRLGKLIAFYDDNGISIDGEVEGWFTDDTATRFESYGWHVVRGVDGHDAAAISAAVEQARAVSDKPSLICCKTIIGWGAPNKQGKEECHGAPLGADEINFSRTFLEWSHEPFVVADDVYAAWSAVERGKQQEAEWQALFDDYHAEHPDLAIELKRRIQGELPSHWAEKVNALVQQTVTAAKNDATRKSSQIVLGGIGALLPELVGGSADLTGSNLTAWSGSKAITAEDASGNYIHYGVREFGMVAIANGIALHGGFIPYDGTFLVFSDYARNALRMSALMGIRTIHVLTHDSIGLGEDGPTHQPIEHIASLRYIPNMSLWRPCDAVETAVAWQHAVERSTGPTCLALSRQGLAHQIRSAEQIANIARGAYVLLEPSAAPQAIIIATGSEVELAVAAAQALNAQGQQVRVVSMPNPELFDTQSASYRDSVLPLTIRARVAVEAGVTHYWRKYVGLDGDVIGIDRFGLSAPAKAIYTELGVTVEAVQNAVAKLLK
ncbi:MAG: transketolase [Gammaproteobacteria bacterium]|nr:transketolase [Gammaproteobacteria bacterium]